MDSEHPMLDTIFTMLYDWRMAHQGLRPRVLRINYRAERVLRDEIRHYRDGGGLLPIATPLAVFGMVIEPEYKLGPWAWLE